MRIAIDTNVLVRYLVGDDHGQAKKATEIIENAETVVISTVTFCEVVWVLKRSYRYANKEIINAIQIVAQGQTVELDRLAVEAGLSTLEKGGDFADGVIAFEAGRARCDRLVTFDRKFAGLPGLPHVTLLETA